MIKHYLATATTITVCLSFRVSSTLQNNTTVRWHIGTVNLPSVGSVKGANTCVY